MRILFRSLPLVVLVAACSGSQDPPPPVATATPGSSTSELQPRSSRDAAPGGAAQAMDPNAPLPPGHPPIGDASAAGGGAGAAGSGTSAADPHGSVPGGTGKSAGTISGTISLAPSLKSGASDVLYVMAKKGKTTIAVKRVAQPSFPYSFEVSGGDAMMAGADFVGPVDLVARLSRSGDAIPAKGDLEGTATGVKIPATGVKLTIDSVRQ